jgi:cathepsin L
MRETNNFFTGDEYKFRLGIFLQNKRMVQEFNRGGKTFKVALNKFAHFTPAEYRSLLGGRVSLEALPCKPSNVKANDDCDWRNKNVVNAIKDQAQCGSCWAFSAIQTQESAYAIAHGKLYSLSEQNLVDCVTSCYGCNGGWPYVALDYVKSKQGGMFNLEEDYPYTAKDGNCKFDSSKGYAQIQSYVSVESRNEKDLASKVSSLGPASVCIDASNWSFQLYSSGIYDEPACSSSSLDHAVGCVGYGSENGVNYWIIRNSWGTSWGEEGYMRLIKDKNNECGTATSAIVAQV